MSSVEVVHVSDRASPQFTGMTAMERSSEWPICDDVELLEPRETLGGSFQWRLPARENQYRWMAIKGSRKNLGAFYAKINSTILDCGDGGLGDAAELGELA